MTSFIGKDLGRYHILEQLGEGGMAVVYKAYDTRLETDVAVKVIRTENLPQSGVQRALKRFEREAKALAKLTHPNIVPIIDYGEYQGSPYLVMKYLPGGTLKQLLKGQPILWQEAAHLLIPVARALDYAHRQGMIHRDVKPANILITDDGEPMLTDFGIAKIIDEETTQELTGTNATVGTPEYMAPEQVVSKTVDQRVDIYGLGIVFYEMVTGRKPFQADTPMAVLFKQASEPLPRPSQFVPGLPEAVERVLIKALAKNPEDRYQSMAEFSTAMGNLANTLQLATDRTPEKMVEAPFPEQVQQGTTSLPIPGSPPNKRKKWAWVVGGVVLLVFLGIVVVMGASMLNKSQQGTNLASLFTQTAAQPIPATQMATVAPEVAASPTASIPPAGQASGVLNTFCTDPIGCVKIAPTDPIHIAYLLVVSGANASLGVDSRNGVEIAIDDAGGKILGHTIQFDGQDGLCTADGGQAAGTKLASDPTIVAVIGTSCSSEARGAEPLLSHAGFLTISPSNTGTDLTDPTSTNHYPGYFRTSWNDKVQGPAVADYVYNTLGLKTAATIQDGSLYASSLVTVFQQDFEQYGGTITTATSVDPNATDMSSILASIATGKPDLIYFPIVLPAGAYIIDQAKTTPGLENTKLMGADGLYSSDVMKTAGAAVEGFMVSSPVVQGAAYDAFVGKYVAKFGEQPINIFHAQAYDAFNMIKGAIEKVAVQETDGTIYIPRQGLRDAIAATKDFQGLTGVLTCNPDGDCANPIIGVYTYQAGVYPPQLIWQSKH